MIQVGDVFRKAGPCDWARIVRVQLPDHAGYDGGLPGCSIKVTGISGRYERRTWFFPAADEADFRAKMASQCRYQDKPATTGE